MEEQETDDGMKTELRPDVKVIHVKTELDDDHNRKDTDKTEIECRKTPTKARIRKPSILQRKRKQPAPVNVQEKIPQPTYTLSPMRSIRPKPIQGIVIGGPITIKTTTKPKVPITVTQALKKVVESTGSSLQVDNSGRPMRNLKPCPMSQRQRYSREAEGKEFVRVGPVKRNKWIDIYPEPDLVSSLPCLDAKEAMPELELSERRPTENEPDFRDEHPKEEVELFNFMKNFRDNDPDSCFKSVSNRSATEQLHPGEKMCPKCNCVVEDDCQLDGGGDDFFIENKKHHFCQTDKCGICGDDLSYLKERMKIRHIIYCMVEQIPTHNGRPLYLTDEHKARKECLCCGDTYSNILPTVEFSYFRRHCISHVLPNPYGRQTFFYKCYYCCDSFQTKQTFITHIISHESEESVCSKCPESFPSFRDQFCHELTHGHSRCPSCDLDFYCNNSTQEQLSTHYDNCYHDKAKRMYMCGICSTKFSVDSRFWCHERKSYESDLAEWQMVRHVIECKKRDLKISNKLCLSCKKMVALNKSLRAHAVLHVLPRDDDNFRCRLACGNCNAICQATFDNRVQLAHHVYERHILVFSCARACNGIRVDNEVKLSPAHSISPVSSPKGLNDASKKTIKRPNILRSRRKLQH